MFLIIPKFAPCNWIPRPGSSYTNDISSNLHGDKNLCCNGNWYPFDKVVNYAKKLNFLTDQKTRELVRWTDSVQVFQDNM